MGLLKRFSFVDQLSVFPYISCKTKYWCNGTVGFVVSYSLRSFETWVRIDLRNYFQLPLSFLSTYPSFSPSSTPRHYCKFLIIRSMDSQRCMNFPNRIICRIIITPFIYYCVKVRYSYTYKILNTFVTPLIISYLWFTIAYNDSFHALQFYHYCCYCLTLSLLLVSFLVHTIVG